MTGWVGRSRADFNDQVLIEHPLQVSLQAAAVDGRAGRLEILDGSRYAHHADPAETGLFDRITPAVCSTTIKTERRRFNMRVVHVPGTVSVGGGVGDTVRKGRPLYSTVKPCSCLRVFLHSV